MGALPAYADLAEFQPARPVSPLYGSYKVSTVAPLLLDWSGLLPIPGHVIGVSRRRRRGSGVRRFGAKIKTVIAMTFVNY